MKGLVGILIIFGVYKAAFALPQDVGSIHFRDEELRKGQECRQGQLTGVCTPIEECPVVDYRQNVSRVFCSTNKVKLICCVPKPISKEELALISRAKITEENFMEYQNSSSYEKCLSMNEIYINLVKLSATKSEFPHMVAIGFQEDDGIDWRCSGTILSERFVLTASDCVNAELKPLFIRIPNKNNQQLLNDNDHKISEIFVNEKLALIEISQPFIFHKYVRPACLYDESFLNTTDIKKLSWTNSKNFELKVDSANIVDNSKCKKDADDKEFICTKPDASECAESSNGVLQTQLPSLQDVETKMYNLHYVIGIEAVGTKCPQENDKFVAVYPYRDWIEGFVWPKETEIRSSFDKRNGLKKSAECLNRHIGLRKNIELSQKDGNSETIAVQGEFPHLAAIGWSRPNGKLDWYCTGTLISPDYVLLPAHCTHYNEKEPDVIRLGDLTLSTDAVPENAQQFGVASITRHDNYSSKLSYNDIALIKLSSSALITENVIPACLRHNSSSPSVLFQGIGYGFVTPFNNQVVKLQKIPLSFISRMTCNESYKEFNMTPEGLQTGQICAENLIDLETEMNVCFGDNSAVLQTEELVDGKRVPVIVGLTSFGMACASNVPNVYTDVFFYKNWIESKIY